MELSFSSLISTILWSNIFILLLVLYLSDYGIWSKRGFYFLSFLILANLFRLFFPIEFLYLQSDVYIAKWWARIYQIITDMKLSVCGKQCSYLTMCVGLSFIGSIGLGIRLIVSYTTLKTSIYKKDILCVGEWIYHDDLNLYTKNNVELRTFFKALQRVMRERSRLARNNYSLRITFDKTITTPFVIGVLKPVIVLPSIKLSEEEWYYIIKHEVIHIINHDLLIRFMCEFLKIIYWWNPLLIVLSRQIENFQEFRVDSVICERLNELQKINYMESLIKLAKQQSHVNGRCVVAFQGNMQLPKRIKALLHSGSVCRPQICYKIKKCGVCFLLIIFGLWLPNFVVIKPYYPVPSEITEIAIANNISGGYYILQEKDTYNIHLSGQFFRINHQNYVMYKTSTPRRINNIFSYTYP